jgi:hypothetical protein
MPAGCVSKKGATMIRRSSREYPVRTSRVSDGSAPALAEEPDEDVIDGLKALIWFSVGATLALSLAAFVAG